jgi:hypothetical protein
MTGLRVMNGEFTAEAQRTQMGRRDLCLETISFELSGSGFEISNLKFEICIPLRLLCVLCASAVSLTCIMVKPESQKATWKAKVGETSGRVLPIRRA